MGAVVVVPDGVVIAAVVGEVPREAEVERSGEVRMCFQYARVDDGYATPLSLGGSDGLRDV